MRPSPSRLAPLFAVASVVFTLAFAPPGVAQPHTAQPQTFEVQRNQQVDDAALLRRLQQQRDMPDHRIEGYVSIPDEKAGLLIQSQGRTFRDVRTRFQPWVNSNDPSSFHLPPLIC